MSDAFSDSKVLRLTANIVSAHVGHNHVRTDDLPALIQQVFQALTNAGATQIQAEKPQPSIPIKQSIRPDYIVCLEDGKKLKMLKRHLQTTYGLTPEAYRTKWGLPPDYPMVAPNYAEHRSTLAKKIGLGRKPGAMSEAAPPPPPPKADLKPAKRGRKPKAAAMAEDD
jgi:predicted transcriptional regulator